MDLQRALTRLDGFKAGHKDALNAFDPLLAGAFFDYVNRAAERLHVSIEGLSHLPEGRALLVANHAFGFDVVFAMAAIWERFRRPVWVLGEHLWWSLPFLRRFVAAIGVVDGTRENVDYLLSREQLVLVLPGGLREAVKPRELRYQLLWGQRYGFVHAALRNQAPMVPLASVGSDELFDFVGNPYERGRRWLKPLHLPLPLPATILPLPRRVNMKFVFGAPVPPRPPSADQDELSHVRSLRREIEGALHELIEGELWRRLDPKDRGEEL